MELVSQLFDGPSQFEYISGTTPFTHWTVPIIIGAVYVTTIAVLKLIMSIQTNRIEAQALAAIHNWNMFAISVVCFIGMLYGVIKLGWQYGIEGLVCDSARQSAGKGTLYFWIYWFYLSKFYELFDTIFIVLRKAPLRFLHFYHHSGTFFLCWVSLEYAIPIQWCATLLNCLVHIPMYWYYFMVVVHPGKDVWWKRYITTSQIVQFVLILVVHMFALFYHYILEKGCRSYNSYGNFFAGIVIWSYLFLFVQYYISTYSSSSISSTRSSRRSPYKPSDKPKEQ